MSSYFPSGNSILFTFWTSVSSVKWEEARRWMRRTGAWIWRWPRTSAKQADPLHSGDPGSEASEVGGRSPQGWSWVPRRFCAFPWCTSGGCSELGPGKGREEYRYNNVWNKETIENDVSEHRNKVYVQRTIFKFRKLQAGLFLRLSWYSHKKSCL